MITSWSSDVTALTPARPLLLSLQKRYDQVAADSVSAISTASISCVPSRGDAQADQDPSGYGFSAYPRLLVVGIDYEVRILSFERLPSPGLLTLVQPLRGLGDQLGREGVPQSFSVTAATLWVDTPCRYISMREHQGLVRSLVTLEELGGEGAVSVTSNHEIQFAHRRG